MKLVHGGDTVGYREKYGRDALDFSANVSPLGTPEAVARAIGAAAYRADRYPDPLCRELCAALGEAEGVPKDWILCGNGAADLIFRLALAKRPRHALVLAPTFAEYEAALETVGCDVRRCALTETNDFAMTEDVLDAIQPPVEIVFLCQPNNPTGQAADRALMRRILAKCEAVGALLAVDECFLDFLPDGEALTMKPELAAHPGLFILKAFTKLYGMAGVCWCHAALYHVGALHGCLLLARLRVFVEHAVYDGLAVAHHPYLLPMFAVYYCRSGETLLWMRSHAFVYAALCVFLCDAARYALAELLQRGFGIHLVDIVADEQHGEASVLHRWVESEGCLACAAVDYSHEVGCAYDAVFTVGCCMLATNETFFDVHSVVLSFFNCLILPCASYRLQKRLLTCSYTPAATFLTVA